MTKPYTKIPNDLLDTLNLSIQARYLLCVLLRHRSGTGKCFPTQATLGKEIGRSTSQVKKILDELLKAGAITKRRRGYNRSNDYFISNKYIVKNLPVSKAKKYGDISKTNPQKNYKTTIHESADKLLNSKQEIVKDKTYLEKEKEFSTNMRLFFSESKKSDRNKKEDSFTNKDTSYQVYNQKTKKIESVGKILESKQINGNAVTNVSTGLMSDYRDHVDSSDLDTYPTKTKASKVVDKESSNVDSDQKGEIA